MPSAKAAEAAALVFQRLYGDRVTIRYHDTDDPTLRPQLAATLEAFAEEGWQLPVTLLDQQLLFSGRLRPERLVIAVAERLGYLEKAEATQLDFNSAPGDAA